MQDNPRPSKLLLGAPIPVAPVRPEVLVPSDEVLAPGFVSTHRLSQSLPEVDSPNHIFVFLDGTWNEERSDAGRAVPTNVLRLYQELTEGKDIELVPSPNTIGKVIARYYRGVGSRQDNSNWRRWHFGFSGTDEQRIRASAFAQLYADLQHRNDSIYILGFSRGAASARLLARDLCLQGLPQQIDVHVTHFSNLLTGQIEARVERIDKIGSTAFIPDVAFLGCWDTVDAFVLPSRYPEQLRRWDKFKRSVKAMVLPRLTGEERFTNDERRVPANVKKAVHCVAIDETRNAFLPTLMPRGGNVEEVWFPGVHADVGGGYRDNGLAEAPYQFMKARLSAAASGTGKNTPRIFKPEDVTERCTQTKYCFHFHGLNTDIKKAGDVLGFGTRIRRIRVLSGTDAESAVAPDDAKPKVHYSTFSVMNSGLAYATNKKEKPIWNVKYDPYNVRELKDQFVLVDEQDGRLGGTKYGRSG